jgi:hypothetical protein
MSYSVVPVTNGPAEADLLQAVAHPEDHWTTIFGTPGGSVAAEIEQIEQLGIDQAVFVLWGHLTSSKLRGEFFTASYNSERKTGRLAVKVGA